MSQSVTCEFRPEYMMRYSQFAPRLYNYCRSLGFEAGNIMPSRAFCSDESQGFPVILIAKHFGAFPFNHGQVGGIVATDRHGPHAHHGKDLVVIQASHVGYDPDSGRFGEYCRLQTEDNHRTTTCGKLGELLRWYQQEYEFARDNIQLTEEQGVEAVVVDNQLLDQRRLEGLFPRLDRLLALDSEGLPRLVRTLSTARVFVAAASLIERTEPEFWRPGGREPIGDALSSDLFSFRRPDGDAQSVRDQLEENLLPHMPEIVTSPAPLLSAAQFNTQAEFDRTFRSIAKAREYRDKKLLFVSCVNIDISPEPGQLFPLTKCVPWAAYVQDGQGNARTLEQAELLAELLNQPADNPDQIDLEVAIQQMIDAREVRIRV
ncbi:hypothetical protein [Motiliproteus sediminis]|uniref:hypothetical protein n=1 Tax=Motiliproteus sediminis TaxID=1468178 RepID=UPI001AF003EB|nr:hypothetical protein [Motiliproteus sediminis]